MHFNLPESKISSQPADLGSSQSLRFPAWQFIVSNKFFLKFYSLSLHMGKKDSWNHDKNILSIDYYSESQLKQFIFKLLKHLSV